MSCHKGECIFKKEEKPLWYMGYLMESVRYFGGICLETMGGYTQWIKAGSYYHLRVWKLKQLWECPHLQDLDPPRQNQLPPSVSSLKMHEATFEVARKNPKVDPKVFKKAKDNYMEFLQLHGKWHQAATIKSISGPDQKPSISSSVSGRDYTRTSTASLQAEASSSDSSSRTEEEHDTDQTIPMEVVPLAHGGGDGHLWGNQVEEEDWEKQGPSCYSHKQRHEVSMPWSYYMRSMVPFPMNDEAWDSACDKLFKEASTLSKEGSKWIFMILRHQFTSKCPEIDIVCLTNLLLVQYLSTT